MFLVAGFARIFASWTVQCVVPACWMLGNLGNERSSSGISHPQVGIRKFVMLILTLQTGTNVCILPEHMISTQNQFTV